MRIDSFLAGIANVHLIDDGEGIIVVDSGWPGSAPAIVKRIKRLGYSPQDVRAILLTHGHFDHAGAAVELRRLTGAPIAAHPGDNAYMAAGRHSIPTGRGWAGVSSKWVADRISLWPGFESFKPDVALEEGQTLGQFGLEGYVLHTPGHTAGSATLALEDGITIIGDALINMIKVGFPMYWEAPEQARDSAVKIQASKPRMLYSGHGRPFSGAELDRYLETYWTKKNR